MQLNPVNFLTGLALLLAACSSAPATSTLSLPPTPTLAPSPTPTITPTPTATLTPTPVPTATFTASPSPTPATINPLTGLVVPDPTTMDRRPLAIKVAHFPRRVRPQFGLSFADNVWEHYAEGGVTRFTAIFLGQSPEKVGNIRSARLIDTILGEAYQAMLVASGSSQGTLDRLRETDFYERVIAEATGYDECPILCREEDRSATTDKLFTSPEALWELTTELGLNGRQNLKGFAFDSEPPAGGEEAISLRLDFQLGNTVTEWRYDPQAGRYARWVDTAELPTLAPHVDALSGQQITAANVVVMYALHAPSNIREDENGQSFSYEIFLTGSGPARLFRDGKVYEVKWERGEKGLPRFVDDRGRPAPFKPGNTWFEVVTPDSPTQFEGGAFSLRFKAPDPFPATPTATP